MSSAAAKRRRAVASTGEVNERLVFAQRIAELSASQQQFSTAIADLKTFNEEALRALDVQLQERRQQLEEVTHAVEVEKKNAEIRIKQELAEFKYDAARKILEERGEVAIDRQELTTMRQTLADSKARHESELEQARKDEKLAGVAALKAALANAELSHKANVAELTAMTNQQANEIKSLHAQLAHYCKEIDKQRELTKQVAEASKQGAIQQTIGKT